jgi:hypothetical protein
MMELYILGLERLQSVDQKDPLSWFQIASIYGRFVLIRSSIPCIAAYVTIPYIVSITE